MCDHCKTVYHCSEKHDPAICPIANALMCSCCKRRGHATLKCPNPVSWQTRVPEYIEQLIPFDLRTHHRIPSAQTTPIQNPNEKPMPCHHIMKDPSITVCSTCRPVMEIPEDKDSTLYTANIRATLASNNLQSTSVKENKKLLEAFAGISGKKVIYLKKDRFIKEALAAAAAATEEPADKPKAKKAGFKVVAKAASPQASLPE